MNSKERTRLKAIQRGYIKPSPIKLQSTYKRTEGAKCFHYGNAVANSYAGYSSKERDEGREPTFTEFYNQLSPEYQNSITVIHIQINNS